MTDALEKGAPQSTACEAAGIAERTFYGWMALGEQGIEPYSQFSQAIRAAKVEGEMALLDRVRVHANEDGREGLRAATWLLERLWPDKYGASIAVRKARQDVVEEIFNRLRERLSPGALAEVIACLADGDGEGEAEAMGASVH